MASERRSAESVGFDSSWFLMRERFNLKPFGKPATIKGMGEFEGFDGEESSEISVGVVTPLVSGRKLTVELADPTKYALSKCLSCLPDEHIYQYHNGLFFYEKPSGTSPTVTISPDSPQLPNEAGSLAENLEILSKDHGETHSFDFKDSHLSYLKSFMSKEFGFNRRKMRNIGFTEFFVELADAVEDLQIEDNSVEDDSLPPILVGLGMVGSFVGNCRQTSTMVAACAESFGIPARRLAGFIGDFEDPTAFSDDNKPYEYSPRTLRSLVAHSWSEVYCAKKDLWLPVDPINAAVITYPNTDPYSDEQKLYFLQGNIEMKTDTQTDLTIHSTSVA